MLFESLIVSTGPVESLIVSTGPVDLNSAHNCIILATGDVKIKFATNVLVISNKDVQLEIGDRYAIATRRADLTEHDLHKELAALEQGIRDLRSELAAMAMPEIPQFDLLYRPGEPPRRIYGLPGPRPESTSLATKMKVNIPPEKLPPPAAAPRQDGIRFFEPEDVGLKLVAARGDRVRIPSAEFRRRLKALLDRLDSAEMNPPPDRLRLLRAAEVLEWFAAGR